jgi:hypothetical protein
MNKTKLLYWLPRVLAILIVGFFALFILEGFSPEFSWQDSLSHGLTALIALGVTILAWKRPKIGGWIFVAFGVYYCFAISSPAEWVSILVVGGVPILTGLLFLREGFTKHD